VLERMLAGVSTRRYRRTQEPVGQQVEVKARSTSKSSVSRTFIERTRQSLGELMSRQLLVQSLAAVEASPRRGAWLALDAGDADLRVFLTHLVAALQTAEPEAGVDALALLEGGGAAPTEAAGVSLINDLEVVAGPTVVALDDDQAIDGTAVHESAGRGRARAPGCRRHLLRQC
jgi:hypothetical protein